LLNKRGVSPLIATVLLLAFAVALATVVIQLDPFTGKCSNVDIKISEIDGSKRVCYDEQDKQLSVYLVNSEYFIESIKVSISGTEDVLNIDDLGVSIGKNTVQKINIPYDISVYGKIVDIIITPRVNVTYAVVECPIKDKIESIGPC
jgi:flagellin-like protein